jgi:predicted nucleic acid-binding protein
MRTIPVCVDASLVIPLVTQSTEGNDIATLWTGWYEARRQVAAPTLLFYEVTNALHRYAVRGELTADEAAAALDAALDLELILHGDGDLHRRAAALAGELALPSAYDAHYLALAEKLGAELWTADRRLYSTAGRVNLPAQLIAP